VQALLKATAVGLATAVLLTSCSDADRPSESATTAPAPVASDATETTAPAETPPASAPATEQPASAPPGEAPPSDAAGPAEGGGGAGGGDARWGSYKSRDHACAAVAANVASLLLVPLGFMTGVEDSDLKALQDELDEFSRGVPPRLEDHLDRVENQLDHAAATGRFDAAGFARALQPVKDWLSEHCGE
jgi:hypothetical protein